MKGSLLALIIFSAGVFLGHENIVPNILPASSFQGKSLYTVSASHRTLNQLENILLYI